MRARLVVLALILLFIAPAKLWYSVKPGPYGLDGGNYFQMARHVAEGDGLVTSISLYHLGLRQLPARTFQTYPVWPLVLGYAGRAIGMHNAADVMPKLFYFVSLVLLWFLANTLARRIRGDDEILPPLLDFGHLFVLLFGLNAVYFWSTTLPYSEGVSFALAFGALVAMIGAERATGAGVAWSAAAGILASLAFLARTQMAMLGVGMAAAFAVVTLFERKLLARAIVFFAAIGVTFVYWWLVIHGHKDDAVDLGAGTYRMWIQQPTTAAWLRERWDGLVISLWPLSRFSYFYQFGLAAALPVIALVMAAIRRPRPRMTSRALLPIAVLLSGLAFFASLDFFHQTGYPPWFFGYRHGLPYVFLILVAAPFLATTRAARITVVAVFAVSIATCSWQTLQAITTPQQIGPTPGEAELVRWLDSQRPLPTVISTDPQLLAQWTHANFHMTLCTTPPDTTRRMLERLPVNYVIVRERERPCPFVSGLDDVLTPRAAFGEGDGRIWVLGRR